MIRSSAAPVSATSLTPWPTCAVEAEISPLISLAASAERWASARTSDGDDRETASRVAGARRLDAGVEREQVGLERDLVDHADDLGDLLRRFGDAVHRSTACLTTTAPFLASLSARGDDLARMQLAPSADFFTVSVIWPSAAAVSSSVAACCSVRRDRSSEACATRRR